jgi:hypothetical protein
LQTWFWVSGSIRAMICWSSSASRGTGLQASVHAAGQVGDAVGTRQAKPGGELAERVFAVAAAEPGSDGASDVGISAMGQCGNFTYVSKQAGKRRRNIEAQGLHRDQPRLAHRSYRNETANGQE